jgi:hypothetical protein
LSGAALGRQKRAIEQGMLPRVFCASAVAARQHQGNIDGLICSSLNVSFAIKNLAENNKRVSGHQLLSLAWIAAGWMNRCALKKPVLQKKLASSQDLIPDARQWRARCRRSAPA